jgi:hypothetical protein
VPAPPEIIDALESVVDIYFSGVRHRERAAFILCDNLVEMACKTRAKQHDYKFDMTCNFHDAINASGVSLPNQLKKRIQGYRDTRNNMQHASAAATVDWQYCATAILDAVRVIDRCWSNTSTNYLTTWMKCALRIICLYSSEGDPNQRWPFEERMRRRNWRGQSKRTVAPTEIQVQPGYRDYWRLAIRTRTTDVEDCLNELGIP